MKKNLLFIFWFIFLLPNITFGNFLSDPTSLDLYKKIDSWYYELELKYLEKELKWWDIKGSITDELNKRAKQNRVWECFSWDISVQQMEQIYNDSESSSILVEFLKDCFDDEESISMDAFNTYFWIIRENYYKSSKKALSKVDNIYKIGRIWMYSDGIEENSPFDLMIDLDDINSIIFEEQIPYDGVNNFDIWRSVDGILSWLSPLDAFRTSQYDNSHDNSNENETSSGISLSDEFCIVDNNNSGLSDDIFKEILGKNNNSSSWNTSSWNTQTEKKPISSYKKINDNSVWPCNNFFCIMIDFVTYNHNLLWWGTNLSIEWLFKRSNTHLKRFASTSLIQSKMTTNNFELGLKDLHLPDIFHVGVQVSYKPVPLLNVDKKETDKNDDEWRYENLFTRYYTNLWLDFKRSNDLDLFTQKEADIKSILDSQEQSFSVAWEKFENFHSYINEIKKQNNYVSSTVIDKKVIHDDIEWFHSKYRELESFTRALMEYTFGAKWIITEMNKIPQWG